jgi:hypothetical protein
MNLARGSRRVTIALGAACAGLVFANVRLVWMGTETSELLATRAKVYAPTKVDLSTPVAANLAPVKDRALFHASRAFYTAPSLPAAPATPPRPQYQLGGTFVIPQKPTVALLTQSGTKVSRKVRAGDDLDGWQVKAVESGRVVLEYNGELAEISRASTGGSGGGGLTHASLTRTDNKGAATGAGQVVQGTVSTSTGASTPTSTSAPASTHVPVSAAASAAAAASVPQVRTLGSGQSGRSGTREASVTTTESRVEARLYRPPPQ